MVEDDALDIEGQREKKGKAFGSSLFNSLRLKH